MLNCVIALAQMGFAPDHPAVCAASRAIDDFLIQCEGTLITSRASRPTGTRRSWLKALLDAGLARRTPRWGAPPTG